MVLELLLNKRRLYFRSNFIFFMGEIYGIELNWWCRCLNWKSQLSISLKLTNVTFLKQISINLKNKILFNFFLWPSPQAGELPSQVFRSIPSCQLFLFEALSRVPLHGLQKWILYLNFIAFELLSCLAKDFHNVRFLLRLPNHN